MSVLLTLFIAIDNRLGSGFSTQMKNAVRHIFHGIMSVLTTWENNKPQMSGTLISHSKAWPVV